jgi:glycerophosphoryl diester phosphodiesterase
MDSVEPFTPSGPFLKKLGEELKQRGVVFQVLPWECSDERAFDKLLELGAASFATDYPEVALRAANRFHERAATHASN